MQKYPITLFIIGALSTSIITALFWMLSLSLFDPTTFEGWKELCYFFTFSFACFLFLVIFLSQRRINEAIKYSSYGGLLPILFGLFLSVKSLMIYYTPISAFDRSIWENNFEKPFDQAVAVYRNEDLIGKSNSEIQKLLGEGTYTSQGFDVQGGWVIRVEYLDNKVNKIEFHVKPPISF